jgi:cysteine desulfurase
VDDWGNPSSTHRHGQRAREAVEVARAAVARLIGAHGGEIVFTASGTEANNAVCNALLGGSDASDQVVVSAIEHPSILVACAAWEEAAGVRVTRVAPGRDGVVATDRLLDAVGPATRMVALMLANNELGTLQPVAEIARGCRERGVPLLCDAVQATGKVPILVEELGVDYLTLGAHKFHGPLGAAALWIRPGARFEPLLRGGSQEQSRRASTENVAAVAGFGRACELAADELADRAEALLALRRRLEDGLASIPDAVIHGAGARRLPHTTSVGFPGLANVELMMRLDLAGVQPSPTLRAMGLPDELAGASIRISFGTTNTPEEVDDFLPVLAREVEALRAVATRDH